MLETTEKKINETARFPGFSQSAFSQFFMRMNKCWPYEWRNLKRYGKKYKFRLVRELTNGIFCLFQPIEMAKVKFDR